MLRNIVIKLRQNCFWSGNKTNNLLMQSFLFLLVMHYRKYSASIFVFDKYISTRIRHYSFLPHFFKRMSQWERKDNLLRNYYSTFWSWNYYLLARRLHNLTLINLFQIHGNMQSNFHQLYIKWNSIYIFDVAGALVKRKRAI